MPTLQLALTAVLIAWMISGFTRRTGRWMRWTMFCRTTFTLVTLTGRRRDGRTEPVNVYDHLPERVVAVHPARLQALLDHLTSDTGPYDRIDGTGRVLSADGDRPIEIRDSRVVG